MRVLKCLKAWCGRPSLEQQCDAPPIRMPDLGDRAVFIIGFARSGTTILQNILNASADFFLFGEPNFHCDPGTHDFGARYNAMHRAWRNQPTKSSFCPPVILGDAAWWMYLTRLADMHRFVGAKIVINPTDGQTGIDALFVFHCQNFYRARTIFAFRNPRSALFSIQGLSRLQGCEEASVDLILGSYVRVIGLYIHMLRTQPHVCAVFHEEGPTAILDRVADFTGEATLRTFRPYYDSTRVRNYCDARLSPIPLRRLALVEDLYLELRKAVAEGPELVQLDQNDGHLEHAHFTKLGHLASRVDTIAAAFDAPSATWPTIK